MVSKENLYVLSQSLWHWIMVNVYQTLKSKMNQWNSSSVITPQWIKFIVGFAFGVG